MLKVHSRSPSDEPGVVWNSLLSVATPKSHDRAASLTLLDAHGLTWLALRLRLHQFSPLTHAGAGPPPVVGPVHG